MAVIEHALLPVRPGMEVEFEAAVAEARPLIGSRRVQPISEAGLKLTGNGTVIAANSAPTAWATSR